MLSTIRGKYTFFTISVVLVFLILLLMVNYYLLRDYSLEQAERTSSLILNGADTQMDSIFMEIHALVASLSMTRSVREVDVGDMAELFINNVLVRKQHVRAIYLGTSDGRMFEWGIGEGFTNHVPEFPPDYDPRKRPWYKEAVADGDYRLTAPYIYASVQALGITAVQPVYNGMEFVGVLGLDLILRGLDNMVNSIELPMGGKIILLNDQAEIMVNQFTPKEEPVTELEKFAFPELIRETSSFTVTDVFNERFLISSVENEVTGWKMLLFIPYDEIMDFSHETITIIIGFNILLMFLLGSLIALVTGRLFTEPLDKIILVFKQFESGKTDARIPSLPGKEFDLMARLFNRLSDQSAEFSRSMEEKVEQRTRAVIRLQKENIRLRIIEEKERIYSNLHDSLGARLTSINISNNVAKSAWERDEKPVLKEMLDRIEKNTRQGIHDLKEILTAGEDDRLLRIDYEVFLDRVVRERLALKNIDFDFRLPEKEDLALLDSGFSADLVKIIQELVSNTVKHAGAKSVKIEISVLSDRAGLKYSDDGVGFNLKDAMKNGFGLQGLFGRTERMGGVLKIISRPGRGSVFDFQFRSGGQ